MVVVTAGYRRLPLLYGDDFGIMPQQRILVTICDIWRNIMRKHIQLGLIIVIMFASFGWAEGNSVKSPESMEIRELRQELRRVVDERVAQG